MKLPTLRRQKKIKKKKISLPRRVVAVDIGTSALKIVEMQLGKNPEIQQMVYHPWVQPVTSRDIDDLFLQEDFIDELEAVFKQNTIKTRHVYLLATSNKLIVRYFDFPPMGELEMQQALQYQVLEQLPYEPDNVCYDYHVVHQDDEGCRVVVFATEKSYINKLLDIFTALSKQVLSINVIPYTLWQVMQDVYNIETKENELITSINLGASLSEVSIFHQDELILFRTIALGGNDFTQAFMQDEDLEEVDAERAKRSVGLDSLIPMGAVTERRNELFDQIWRSIQYVISRNRGYTLKSIYLTGGTALLKGLIDQLQRFIEVQMQNFGYVEEFELLLLEPFASYNFQALFDISEFKEQEILFSLALGLARGGV